MCQSRATCLSADYCFSELALLKKTIKRVGPVQSGPVLIIISLKINLFSPWYSWKVAELALNNNHSTSCGRYFFLFWMKNKYILYSMQLTSYDTILLQMIFSTLFNNPLWSVFCEMIGSSPCYDNHSFLWLNTSFITNMIYNNYRLNNL